MDLPVKVHLARCPISWLNMMMAKKSSAISNMRRMWTACLAYVEVKLSADTVAQCRLRSKNSRRRAKRMEEKQRDRKYLQKLQRKISAVLDLNAHKIIFISDTDLLFESESVS